MKTIPLAGAKAAGRVALIDDDDFELVSAHRWHVYERHFPSGRIEGPYAVTNLPQPGRKPRQVNKFMHALITGYARTDHADHDGLNNQRSNLRPASAAQNNHNQRPQHGHSSQYKGVTWHKNRGKWQATIKVDGRCRYLGVFASEHEAAEAYNRAAAAAYGEYAYLNRVIAA